MHRPDSRWLVAAGLAVLTVMMAPAASASRRPVGFGKPTWVDSGLPGGEPSIATDPRTGQLFYASHLGDTQVDGLGIGGASMISATARAYRNQVLVWTSTDAGRTWRRLSQSGGFSTSGTSASGFSDPDLTIGSDRRVYLTMINPGADALASTRDAGESWEGTPSCHEGDRPFLAAGRDGQAFLATSDDLKGELVAASLDGGRSCVTATATAGSNDWQGAGKPIYLARSDELLLPWLSSDKTSVGVARLQRPGAQFASGHPADLTRTTAAAHTTVNQHWPVLAADAGGTLYLAWDTATGQPDCNLPGSGPVPNRILLSWSTDDGRHWSPPKALTDGRSTAFWPSITAGSGGHAYVAWYQYDRTVTPLCAPADAPVRIKGASVDLTDRSLRTTPGEVSGRPIHYGNVCSGVGCVALNGDRRLGDLFSITLDGRGCVVVASGDTTLDDPVTGQRLPWSQPLFIKQDSGPSLTTGRPCR